MASRHGRAWIAVNQDHVKQKNTQRPIVCGTDFSAAAAEAVDIAAAMARQLGTELVLVHVDEFYGLAPVDPNLFAAALSEKRTVLDQEATRLRSLGTQVKDKLFSGSAFDQLVAAATDAKGRLIVVGAVGHGLVRRVFLGSVAERTAEASPVPTLVVRPKSNLAAWIDGKHVLKILVGYDFSEASDAALRWVNQLTEIGKFQATVLYTNWPPDEARRLGYEGPLPLVTNPADIQKNLERDLKNRVARFLPKQEVTVIVEPGWGTPEGYLFEMASRQKVDLIVVGTHQRHGLGRILLGSVSRAVLHHAKVAVAVVPPAETVMRKRTNENESIQRKVVALASNPGAYWCPSIFLIRRRARCAMRRNRAAESGGSLIIIYVVPADYGWLGFGRDELRDLDRSLQRQAADRLRAFADENVGQNVPADLEVRVGQPAEEIVAAARESKCDSIMLSTRGLTGLDRYLIGSVADRVARLSTVPGRSCTPRQAFARSKTKAASCVAI